MNEERYIELLKKVLTDYNHIGYDEFRPISDNKINIIRTLDRIFLRRRNYYICKKVKSVPEDRMNGKDLPANADTMIGLKRLDNIEFCFQQIIKDGVQGDFIETGVWRGGAAIFMKALLNAFKINDRIVWVADSFAGLPKPDVKKYKADEEDKHYLMKELAVSLETVKENFNKYDLLDDKVKFLKGWFKDTLPAAPINRLALLRLDGDMYESTMDSLIYLYPKLSVGGFVIIDDWGYAAACKEAVKDYRQKHDIAERIVEIDWTGVYWRKTQ